MLFFACAFILCRNVYYAVCVDIACNFDLRTAARSCRNSVKRESAESCIGGSLLTFALKNMNFNRCLTVCRRREYLRFLYRDSGVSFNYLCADAAERFNTERKRSNVEKKKVLYLAAENAALNSCTDSNTFIGVNALERIFAAEILNSFLNSGNTS